ncbi:MAG: hypothetical protein KGQ87_03640 [Verrucomicrobia bacterium]|nr:hypothetical protein [Verrucomicrobiota bacterium]
MNWLNLSTQTLDSENFLGSDPVGRATWLCLLRYCIGQENGGIITACDAWADRKWQQLVRVTKEEVMQTCDLWSWEGDRLIVWGYPKEKEDEIQHLRHLGKMKTTAKQDAAKANGKLGGRPKTQQETQQETQRKTQQETEQETQQKPNKKPIEEKGNRIEENSPPTPQGEESEASAAADDFYADEMPTSTAEMMNELEKRVRSLKSGWELPLGHTEQRQLAAAARCLCALKTADWQTLRDYLHAKIPDGVPAWQPRMRSKFLENPSDVWAHAVNWKRKQEARRPPSNTIPMPVSSRPVISREELAEMLGQNGILKKM